jgi:hypothetical protein
MKGTSNTFNVLQATAAIVGLAIILWSFGLPSLRFAEAANVTQLSDTLSDSAPSVVSDHTITFITTNPVANGETITIDFSDGPFVVGAVDYTDIDVLDDTNDLTATSTCAGASEEVAASFTGTLLTIEFCSGNGASLPANGTTTIKIGLNATFGDTGNAQLTNPAAGSTKINIVSGGTPDTGETIVAIVPSVTVTASVDTRFTFTVSGVAAEKQLMLQISLMDQQQPLLYRSVN